MSSKSSNLLLKIKNEIKIELINYFDDIKCQIDSKAQQLLLEKTLKEAERFKILDLNERLIGTVESLYKKNNETVNKYFGENLDKLVYGDHIKDKIKMDTLTGCYFFQLPKLKDSFKENMNINEEENQIGVLIITDWFLDANQYDYMRLNVEKYICQDIIFNYNKEIINLKFCLDKSIYTKSNSSEICLTKQEIIQSLTSASELTLCFKDEIFSVDVIDENTFYNLKNLKTLNLSGLEFAREISNIARLDKLANCLLKTIVLKNLTNLQEFCLNNFHIKLVDDEKWQAFKSLPLLKVLHLNGNEMNSLSDDMFSGLEGLEELQLRNNHIRFIHNNSFKSLKNLKCLNMKFNNLDQINKCIFNHLINLKELSLGDNNIKEIEGSAFASLIKLEKLDLNRNKLDKLKPEIFLNLYNLKELDLWNNEIRTIKAKTFKSLAHLQTLYLSYNKIEKINESTFLGLDNLEILYLWNNEIRHIEANSFKSLKKLENLVLSFNHLKNLNSKAFRGLNSLKELYLNRNMITHIDTNSFRCLTQLNGLYLDFNPIYEKNPVLFSLNELKKTYGLLNLNKTD